MSKGIWVVAEHKAGELEEVSLELLCEGQRLSSMLGEELCAVLLGYGVERLTKSLASYGAEKVYLVEHELLASHNSDAYTYALSSLIQRYTPAVVLCPNTATGRDFVPRVAVRVKAPLVTDCTNSTVDEQGRLRPMRLVYGEKLEATVVCPPARPQIVTIAPGVVALEKPSPQCATEIIRVDVGMEASIIRTETLGYVKVDPKTIDLHEAEIIVAGGKGAGSMEGFCLIEQLADSLEGCVAGTRRAVDADWISSERQVGQTGKTVSPKLYIACGISGSMQHTVGMKGSKQIVAINTDRNAPIFKIADVGIADDLHDIIPEIIEELHKRETLPHNESRP